MTLLRLGAHAGNFGFENSVGLRAHTGDLGVERLPCSFFGNRPRLSRGVLTNLFRGFFRVRLIGGARALGVLADALELGLEMRIGLRANLGHFGFEGPRGFRRLVLHSRQVGAQRLGVLPRASNLLAERALGLDLHSVHRFGDSTFRLRPYPSDFRRKSTSCLRFRCRSRVGDRGFAHRISVGLEPRELGEAALFGLGTHTFKFHRQLGFGLGLDERHFGGHPFRRFLVLHVDQPRLETQAQLAR